MGIVINLVSFGTINRANEISCGIAAALPGVIHLVLTYENDLKTALVENVMAGGDSAARGLATGMLLGAYLGMQSIPEHWLADMQKHDHILDLLGKLPVT